MKVKFLIPIFFLLVVTIFVAQVKANSLTWTIVYPSRIKVDAVSNVSVQITTNESIDLHVAFKSFFDETAGNYWTGHWSYEEQKTFVPAGTINKVYTFSFRIPYELWAERVLDPRFRPQYYYFFVYSTIPNGSYGTGYENKGPSYLPAKVIFQPLNLQKLLTTAVGMLKSKLLDSLDLNSTVKEILFSKLFDANVIIDEVFLTRNKTRICDAKILLGDFIDEVEGLYSFWLRRGEAINHAKLIISKMDLVFKCPGFCAGAIDLHLEKNQTCPKVSSIRVNVINLLECSRKRVFFKLDSCNGETLGYCTVINGKCSTNIRFPSAGIQKLFACIDKNGDNDFNDLGEQDFAFVDVNYKFCPSSSDCEYAGGNWCSMCGGPGRKHVNQFFENRCLAPGEICEYKCVVGYCRSTIC